MFLTISSEQDSGVKNLNSLKPDFSKLYRIFYSRMTIESLWDESLDLHY